MDKHNEAKTRNFQVLKSKDISKEEYDDFISRPELWTDEELYLFKSSKIYSQITAKYLDNQAHRKYMQMRWIEREYMKQWCLPNKLSEKVLKGRGAFNRLNKIMTMTKDGMYDSMDMIIIVLKLSDQKHKKETNFASVFCELINNIPPIRRFLIKTAPTSELYHDVVINMYNSSPSYISCDGEYRARLCKYRNYNMIRRKHPDIFTEIETYITYRKIRRQWNIVIQYFYPSLEQESKSIQVELAIKSENVHTKLLAISWFQAIYNEMLGMTETHSNEQFREIFLLYKEEDIEFIKSLIDKYSTIRIEEIRIALSQTISSSGVGYELGYKMIPLNIKEVQDPLKIKYRPWREYFVSRRCNDLVLNAICPSFSYTNEWFYIKNSKKGLFDNTSQYERMKNSEIAKEVVHLLFEAQHNTYFAAENIPNIIKTAEEMGKFINPKFRKLSSKIDEAINYSKENIIMSEVTLGIVNEYVGRTISDTMAILNNKYNRLYNEQLGRPLSDGYDYFAKYMFEICYALYCINSKLGMIHGDFHLNNATIGRLYSSGNKLTRPKTGSGDSAEQQILAHIDKLDELETEDIVEDDDLDKSEHKQTIDVPVDLFEEKIDQNEHVLYNLNTHSYLFPNNGYFGCLIDLSRAIIDPNKYLEFADPSLPSIYKLVKDEDKFRADEINSLITLYIQLFPSKLKQKEELVVLFKNHFDAVFKILTVLDLYMFTVRLLRIFQKMTVEINKKCIQLIEKLFKMSEAYITQEMNSMIDNPVQYEKKIKHNEWPMFVIIQKCFVDFQMHDDKKIDGVITDAYCYSNELKYSMSALEKFPPHLNAIRFLKDDDEVETYDYMTRLNYELRLEHERQRTSNLEMMNYIAMRHSQKFY